MLDLLEFLFDNLLWGLAAARGRTRDGQPLSRAVKTAIWVLLGLSVASMVLLFGGGAGVLWGWFSRDLGIAVSASGLGLFVAVGAARLVLRWAVARRRRQAPDAGSSRLSLD
jgi:membrane associated rhomboid family serine protease